MQISFVRTCTAIGDVLVTGLGGGTLLAATARRLIGRNGTINSNSLYISRRISKRNEKTFSVIKQNLFVHKALFDGDGLEKKICGPSARNFFFSQHFWGCICVAVCWLKFWRKLRRRVRAKICAALWERKPAPPCESENLRRRVRAKISVAVW